MHIIILLQKLYTSRTVLIYYAHYKINKQKKPKKDKIKMKQTIFDFLFNAPAPPPEKKKTKKNLPLFALQFLFLSMEN